MGGTMDAMPVIPAAAAALHSRMESCLERDLFSLVIQPTVDFRTGCAFTGEALSRLNHPVHGSISADVFIPNLDALGLCSKFDRYIFRKCCIWLYHAQEKGRRFDRITCNFSRKTLSQEGLARDLIRIADSYGIPHHKLGVEIIERDQATDLRQFTENLRQLKAAGFRIILDDYGSGVTDESELHSFPLDMVKLDRSLLLKTGTEKGAAEFRALVAKLIRLNVEVLCEGIETEEQDSFAREAGCHYGQGFLYFRPVPQEHVFERIHQRFRNEAYPYPEPDI
ncbi:MAG: EAL domain-containing protein [Oscillospiraceae bacterium]|nr:EAL domain-containing protein [Oscillospiraceae bacterium]MBQ7130663.1 EAL domain-containing protein [Oscillospiraceae bacterium]